MMLAKSLSVLLSVDSYWRRTVAKKAKKVSRRRAAPVISEAEIAQFAKKLDRWGESLPENQKALLALVVNRSALVERGAVVKARLQKDFIAATRRVFAGFRDVFGAQGWVKIHPIWYKEDGIDFGQVEITTTATMKKKL